MNHRWSEIVVSHRREMAALRNENAELRKAKEEMAVEISRLRVIGEALVKKNTDVKEALSLGEAAAGS